jgi:hypothetical protein
VRGRKSLGLRLWNSFKTRLLPSHSRELIPTAAKLLRLPESLARLTLESIQLTAKFIQPAVEMTCWAVKFIRPAVKMTRRAVKIIQPAVKMTCRECKDHSTGGKDDSSGCKVHSAGGRDGSSGCKVHSAGRKDDSLGCKVHSTRRNDGSLPSNDRSTSRKVDHWTFIFIQGAEEIASSGESVKGGKCCQSGLFRDNTERSRIC